MMGTVLWLVLAAGFVWGAWVGWTAPPAPGTGAPLPTVGERCVRAVFLGFGLGGPAGFVAASVVAVVAG